MSETAAREDAELECASVGASTAESHGWDLGPPVVADSLLKDFKDAMTTTFQDMRDKVGGPAQYLQARFHNDSERKKQFARWLFEVFPMSDLESYAIGPKLPCSTVNDRCPAKFYLHVACLTWEAAGSVKGPPEAATTDRILEEILTDGFVTSTEPLQVCQRLSRSLQINGPSCIPEV